MNERPSISERRGDALCGAAIILLSVVLFAPFIFHGKVFLAADNLYVNYPWKALVPPDFKAHNPLLTDPLNHNWAGIYNRQLHEGGLRNWNPYIMTGIPNTGVTALSGMSGRWYPLKLLLHRLFDTATALNLLLFIHVTLMGLTMFFFLREIGAGNRGALFGAVAYMFNGVAMVWMEYESTVANSALLPLLLLCPERFLGNRRYLSASLGAAVLGMMWLMGHLQYMIYTFLMMFFYFLFLAWRRWREGGSLNDLLRLILPFGITSVGGTLIGAVEILPTAELLRGSARVNWAYTYDGFFSRLGRIPFRQFVGLVFPDYFGSPVRGLTCLPTPPSQSFLVYQELALSMGIPTLFALLAAAVAGRDARNRFFLGMTLLFALLMTGTFVYYPFFKLVPGMDRMMPTRIVWLFTFSAIVAASFGFRAMDGLAGKQRRIYLCLVALLAGGVLLLALVSSRPSIIAFFNAERLGQIEDRETGLLESLVKLRMLSSPVMLKPLLLTMASAVLFSLLVMTRHRLRRVALFTGVLGFLAFELIGSARGFNTVVEPRMIYPRTPGIEYLQRQEGPFRVLVHTSTGWTSVNTLAPFGIEEVGGYSSAYPVNIHRLMSSIEWGGQSFVYDRWIRISNPGSPLFDLLNVKYFLTAPDTSLNDPRLTLVHQGDMNIYKNTRVLPRAFIVHAAAVIPDRVEAIKSVKRPGLSMGHTVEALNFMRSADFDMRRLVVLHEKPEAEFLRGITQVTRPPELTLTDYDPDRLAFTAELSVNGWLVLTDTYYPGWRAYVDGQETRITRANVNFRAVAVPQGKHQVVFEYRPASVRYGKLLSLVGVLSTALGAVWFAHRGGALPGSPPG